MNFCCCCYNKSRTRVDNDDNGSKPLLAAASTSDEKKMNAACTDDDGSMSELSGSGPEFDLSKCPGNNNIWNMSITKLLDEQPSWEDMTGIAPELQRSEDVGHTVGDIRISKILNEQPSLSDFDEIISESALETKSPNKEPDIPISWEEERVEN